MLDAAYPESYCFEPSKWMLYGNWEIMAIECIYIISKDVIPSVIVSNCSQKNPKTKTNKKPQHIIILL